MKTSTTYTHLLIILCALFISACSPEQFSDASQDNDGPTAGAYGPETLHEGLDALCGNWKPVQLTDGQGNDFLQGVATPFGLVEMNNDDTKMAIRMSLGNNWFMDHVNVYVGDLNRVVKNGQIEIGPHFQIQEIIDQACGYREWILPLTTTGATNNYIFVGEIAQLSGYFNGLDENTRTQVWANASPIADGFSFNYSYAVCVDPLLSAQAQCSQAYRGYPSSECNNLTMVATGGVQPYTYSWSNGAATQGITVCPLQTTTYTATVTDANGSTASTQFTVNVRDVRCGNNGSKVQICHVPPGNPTNVQDICISRNAVPAHMGQGHTGCYLGHCNQINPCQ